MTLKDSFKTALTGLKTNKSRSILTTLGIVIGITSIILMMSIGQGAERLILGEISGLGAETIIIRPGKEPSGPSDFAELLFSESLKKRDLDALLKKSNVPLLTEAVPAMIIPGAVSYEGETYRATVFGSNAEFFARTFDVYPTEGAVFDDDDIRENASVAVIGAKVAEELFGNSDALDQFIKIKDRKFRVVGIFPKKGQVSLFNFDELVIIPYTTAQVYVLGVNFYNEIITRAQTPEDVDRTVHDIELTLRENHNITDPKDDDFYIQTQQGAVDQIKTIIGALTAFLSSVVAIALVVGGIGVMNIMLVSVTERTREIGLRKALGATERDILLQFLFEAVTLTAVGGVIGILLGAGLSFLASLILTNVVGLNWTFVFPIFAAILGFSVSAGVGLVFGIYPARQAAAKSPIEALRYE